MRFDFGIFCFFEKYHLTEIQLFGILSRIMQIASFVANSIMLTGIGQTSGVVPGPSIPIPTPDQMAGWSASQFIQVAFGLCLIGIMAAGVWILRQMNQNTKDLNSHNDKMFNELVERYDVQDARYEKQEMRHNDRDRQFNETLRAGLDKIAEKIGEAMKGR